MRSLQFFSFLCFFFNRSLSADMVYTFEPSSENEISHIRLSGPPHNLPNQFIFCMSHIESFIGQNFFTILGEDDQAWMSMSIWYGTGSPVLWMRAGITWHRIAEMKPFWLNFWLHTCVQININDGKIRVNLNNLKPITFMINGLKANMPTSLQEKMLIGVSEQGKEDDPKQFVGSVANIQLLEDNGQNNITEIVTNMCDEREAILAYSSMTWTMIGNVSETEAPSSEICFHNSSYKLGIPAQMSLEHGILACAVASGKMASIEHFEELDNIVSIFETHVCQNLWVPLSDDQEEGIFTNIYDKKLANYLPWLPGAPDGGSDENEVILDISLKLYNDVGAAFKQSCTICEIPVNTTFTLIGGCEDTFLGEIIPCLIRLKLTIWNF